MNQVVFEKNASIQAALKTTKKGWPAFRFPFGFYFNFVKRGCIFVRRKKRFTLAQTSCCRKRKMILHNTREARLQNNIKEAGVIGQAHDYAVVL